MRAGPSIGRRGSVAQRGVATAVIVVLLPVTVHDPGMGEAVDADEHTRECVGVLVERSITADRLVDELERIVAHRRLPRVLRCDNGPEFVSQALADWAKNMVAPGSLSHSRGSHVNNLAVTVGFEPTVGSTPTQLFESCTFGRSDTSPRESLAQVRGRFEPAATAAEHPPVVPTMRAWPGRCALRSRMRGDVPPCRRTRTGCCDLLAHDRRRRARPRRALRPAAPGH